MYDDNRTGDSSNSSHVLSSVQRSFVLSDENADLGSS